MKVFMVKIMQKKIYIFEIKKKKGFVGTKNIFDIKFKFDLNDKKIDLFESEISKNFINIRNKCKTNFNYKL